MRSGWAVILAAGVLTAVVGLGLALAGLPILRGLFVGVNVATFLCYGRDKYLARVGGWRIPEATLHLLAAVGGTPGAFVGQVLFRHKTRDRRFRRVFLAIAVVQVIVLTVARHLRGG